MSQHYLPKDGFSNPVSIINKIAYQTRNIQFKPLENLSMDGLIANLSVKSESKERFMAILKSKQEDEKIIKNYVYNQINTK